MDRLFYPQTVAIVGLSPSAHNLARIILQNCLHWSFSGTLFGVHPQCRELHGIPVLPSVKAIPQPVDVATVLLNARAVPRVVEECGEAGIPYVCIPAGGFTELGPEGDDLINQILQTARRFGTRIVGPNGLMVLNADNGLALPFFPIKRMPTGDVSVLVQSGGIGLSFLNLMSENGIGIQKFASMGNKADLDEVDYLEYLTQDSKTKIIILYLESITRGREFMRAVAACPKPVIVCKANRTETAGSAAFSHTAAMLNDDDVVTAAFQQCGAVRVDLLEELIVAIKALKLPKPKGNKLVVISPSGGHTIMAADECPKLNLTLAKLSDQFLASIAANLNAGVVTLKNPLDLGDVYESAFVDAILEQAIHEPDVDAGVVISLKPHLVPGPDSWENAFAILTRHDTSPPIARAIAATGKPVAVVIYTTADRRAAFQANPPFPLFTEVREALTALSFRLTYTKEQFAFEAALQRDPVMTDRLGSRQVHPSGILTLRDSLSVIQEWGIPTVPWAAVTEIEQACSAAKSLGYPVVIKVDSPDIAHKSDAGMVRIGIEDEQQLRQTFRELTDKLNRINPGPPQTPSHFIVQPMVKPGTEMILGLKRDQAFGPVILCGLGGIYVHILQDTVHRVAPFNQSQALDMISRLRAYPLLSGARGKTPVDLGFLATCLTLLSNVGCGTPELAELDINPLIMAANGKGGAVVDARIKVNPGVR